jgi:hypothetical protein
MDNFVRDGDDDRLASKLYRKMRRNHKAVVDGQLKVYGVDRL